MSFDTIERSNYDGQPIRLYEFSIGTVFHRYASGEEKVTLPGAPTPHVYDPLPISDGGMVQSGDGQSNETTITLPSSAPIAQLFNTVPPSEELWVAIRELHYGDTEAPVVWIGTVASSKQTGLAITEFTCQLLTASFERNGLRLGWGRQCPHALYDRNCRVNKAAYAAAIFVESFNGNTVVSDALNAFPGGYFNNGFYEFSMIPGVLERRAIEVHYGGSFLVLGTTEGLSVGGAILVYPGCARNTSECISKFNNLANYGGFPHLPGKSPFSGDPVF